MSRGRKESRLRRPVSRRRPAEGAGVWKMRRVGRLQILEAVPLAELGWVVHGFSTRPGGVSVMAPAGAAPSRGGGKARARVLNLGNTEWDSPARVAENRKNFLHGLGADGFRVVTLRQIHSDAALRADRLPASASEPPAGDALFTRAPGLLLAVQTADCIPILLADARQRAVAAVHAGWRGTLRRIAEKTLGRMRMEFGTRPEDVIAALGPGIGRCCYEVGPEVAREFHARFPQARDWFDGPFDALAAGESDPNWLPWLTMKPPGHAPPSPRVQLDLIAANRAILGEAGVPARKIFSSDYCTACRTDLFFSYRREHQTGRAIAAIGIREQKLIG